MDFKVIIVGSGLSGSLLANGLLNNSVDVTVYERDAANSKREGYLIRLGEGAIHGFRSCLMEEQTVVVLSKFSQTDGASTAPALYTSDFRLLLDLTRLPSWTKAASINRVTLREELLKPIQRKGLVRFGKTFSRYEIFRNADGAEQVRVHFTDGTTDCCDLLIGADGSASTINEQLGANNLVEITSHWSFHAKGRLPYERMLALPSQLRKGPIAVFSKGAQLFYALNVISHVYDGSANKVAPDEIYDEKNSSFYWGLHIPREDIPYEEIWEIPDKRQACMDYIQSWAPELQQMLSVGAKDEDATDLYVAKLRASTKPPKDWRLSGSRDSINKGHPRIWLIGDSIHPMLPNRGQGGNQALLDCADILPEILRLHMQAMGGRLPSTDDVRRACERYEEKMFPRAFDWVKKSGGAVADPHFDLDGWKGRAISVVGSIIILILIATGNVRRSMRSFLQSNGSLA